MNNRTGLLSTLRAKYGFQSKEKKATKEEVKNFLDENDIDVPDFDKVWAKTVSIEAPAKKAVNISYEATEGEEVNVKSAADAEEDVPAEPTKSVKAFYRANAPAIHASKGEHKRYNAKAAHNLTVFTDADTAEYCGAWARLAICKAIKLKAYSHKARDLEIVGKAMSLTDGSGGDMVPDDFLAAIIDLKEKCGGVSSLVGYTSMSRETLTISLWGAEEPATHLTQNVAITPETPVTDKVTLVAKKIGKLVLVGNELETDSAIKVADQLAKSMARALCRRVEKDYVNGDGSGSYGGITGLQGALPADAYITAEGNDWDSITEQDFNTLEASPNNVDPDNLAYLCSRHFYTQAMAPKVASKAGTAVEYATADMRFANGGANARFKGYPVYWTPECPRESDLDQKCAYFGDFKNGSKIGEVKGSLEIASSEHRNFDSDQTAYRAIQRIAVDIHGDGDATSVGPIVCLRTSDNT